MQKLVAVRLLGSSPHIGEMYQFGVLPVTFCVTHLFRQAYRCDRSTDFHAPYVKMRGSARTAFLWKLNDDVIMLGVKSPNP